MELQGIVKKIEALQTFDSGFQKQSIVLLTEEQYPQPILIEFMKDKVDLIKYIKEGDKAKVSINISGREWTNPQGEVKYFNSITAWRVEKLDSGFTTEPSNLTPEPTPTASDNLFDDEDDLPF